MKFNECVKSNSKTNDFTFYHHLFSGQNVYSLYEEGKFKLYPYHIYYYNFTLLTLFEKQSFILSQYWSLNFVEVLKIISSI